MNKYIAFINYSFNYFSLWYLIWFGFVYNNYIPSTIYALQATGIHVSITSIYFCWIKNTLPTKYIMFKTLCGDILGHHVPLIIVLNLDRNNTNIYYYPFYYNIFAYLLFYKLIKPNIYELYEIYISEVCCIYILSLFIYIFYFNIPKITWINNNIII